MPAPLRLRAIAVLVALRDGPLTAAAIDLRIGDQPSDDLAGLFRDMIGLGLIVCRGSRWYLDHEGLAVLQRDGLDAAPEARAWHGADRSAPEHHQPDAVAPDLAVDVNVDAYGRRTVRS